MNSTNTADHVAIQGLEAKRYDAVLNQDFEAFERLCHPQLVYGHTGGNRDSLATYLTKLRKGSLRYHRIDHPVENIVVIENIALVTGRMNADVTVNGIKKVLNNTALAVWIKTAGQWKFLAYQPTPQPVSSQDT